VARERELLLIRQRLIAEYQDGVLIHAGLDRGDFLWRQWSAAVDAGHLAGENGVDLSDRCGHRAELLSAARA
jgi:hypothetical protein